MNENPLGAPGSSPNQYPPVTPPRNRRPGAKKLVDRTNLRNPPGIQVEKGCVNAAIEAFQKSKESQEHLPKDTLSRHDVKLFDEATAEQLKAQENKKAGYGAIPEGAARAAQAKGYGTPIPAPPRTPLASGYTSLGKAVSKKREIADLEKKVKDLEEALRNADIESMLEETKTDNEKENQKAALGNKGAQVKPGAGYGKLPTKASAFEKHKAEMIAAKEKQIELLNEKLIDAKIRAGANELREERRRENPELPHFGEQLNLRPTPYIPLETTTSVSPISPQPYGAIPRMQNITGQLYKPEGFRGRTLSVSSVAQGVFPPAEAETPVPGDIRISSRTTPPPTQFTREQRKGYGTKPEEIRTATGIGQASTPSPTTSKYSRLPRKPKSTPSTTPPPNAYTKIKLKAKQMLARIVKRISEAAVTVRINEKTLQKITASVRGIFRRPPKENIASLLEHDLHYTGAAGRPYTSLPKKPADKGYTALPKRTTGPYTEMPDPAISRPTTEPTSGYGPAVRAGKGYTMPPLPNKPYTVIPSTAATPSSATTKYGVLPPKSSAHPAQAMRKTTQLAQTILSKTKSSTPPTTAPAQEIKLKKNQIARLVKNAIRGGENYVGCYQRWKLETLNNKPDTATPWEAFNKLKEQLNLEKYKGYKVDQLILPSKKEMTGGECFAGVILKKKNKPEAICGIEINLKFTMPGYTLEENDIETMVVKALK